MKPDAPGYRAALSRQDYHKLTGFDGDWRDTWWNDDFLAMMAQRWGLDTIGTVLDVGCGVGHWGQRLLQHLNDDTTLYGLDPEEAWIVGAKERAVSLGQADRSEFRVGSAESLPWSDGSLDMVTCQTLLIHVANVKDVVREMIRVLRPGGLFLVAEPNNFGSTAGSHIENPLLPWSKVSDLLELEYRCTQGKFAVGEGHQSAGHIVPETLNACGWTDINVHLNNQTASIAPPYDDLAAKTFIQFMRTCYDSGAAQVLGSTEDNCRRYYLAGGGDEARFPELWTLARAVLAKKLTAIDAGEYISAGGHMHYLVWGRKPE